MALSGDEEEEAAAEALALPAAGESCDELALLEPDDAAESAEAADSEAAA